MKLSGFARFFGWSRGRAPTKQPRKVVKHRRCLEWLYSFITVSRALMGGEHPLSLSARAAAMLLHLGAPMLLPLCVSRIMLCNAPRIHICDYIAQTTSGDSRGGRRALSSDHAQLVWLCQNVACFDVFSGKGAVNRAFSQGLGYAPAGSVSVCISLTVKL